MRFLNRNTHGIVRIVTGAKTAKERLSMRSEKLRAVHVILELCWTLLRTIQPPTWWRLSGAKIVYILQAEMTTEKTEDSVSNGLTMIGRKRILARANVMTDGIRSSRPQNSIARMVRGVKEKGERW
jgi:hypothetical protein